MLSGLEIRPFFQSGTSQKKWQNFLLAIPMDWQILRHPRTKNISRDDSFYSGMAVSLTCQSCGLACPQRLILPLVVFNMLIKNENPNISGPGGKKVHLFLTISGGNAPQAPGQINLKHLNIPPRSAEPGKRTAQELSKDKMQLLGQIGEGDAALGNAYISGDNILTDVDMDFVYDKGYAEGDTPMPLEVAEGSEVKACEKFEAIINKMRQKAELLNNTREEQIHKKQQILEELQKVEQELQEKDKAQLLLYAQARLEQERQKQLQQLQKKKEEVEANARNTVPSLQEQSAAVANSQTTALHVAVDHSGLLTCQVEEGIENSIATDIEQDLHALSDCGDDNQLIKKPKLAKQESLGSSASMGSSADSICSHNDSKETSKTDQLSPECTDLSLQPREAKRVKHASDGYEGGGVQGDKQDPDKDVSSDNSSRASSEEIDLSCVLPACTTSLTMSATATALTSEYPTTLDPLIQEQLARQLQQLTLDVATQPQVKNAASLVSKGKQQC